ncbi:hypothetical protein [Pyrococcus kukulkanii]|uniref:Spiroplasmavirus-related protein n=1 Tax=Pyrococcus kukulkanii TaxID=1609559 RepID=A0ABV4T6C1_9EURY
MSWWEEFFSGFSGPLKFLDFITNYVWDEIKDKIGDIIQKVIDAILGALKAIWNALKIPYDVLHSLFENMYYWTYSIAGPLAPILFITIVGAVGVGVIWVLKRLYELL